MLYGSRRYRRTLRLHENLSQAWYAHSTVQLFRANLVPQLHSLEARSSYCSALFISTKHFTLLT